MKKQRKILQRTDSVVVEIRAGKFPFACQTLLAESVRVIKVGPKDGEMALKTRLFWSVNMQLSLPYCGNGAI
jgi:hypothetical protein